jgi:hypothetical protein
VLPSVRLMVAPAFRSSGQPRIRRIDVDATRDRKACIVRQSDRDMGRDSLRLGRRKRRQNVERECLQRGLVSGGIRNVEGEAVTRNRSEYVICDPSPIWRLPWYPLPGSHDTDGVSGL